MYRVTPPSTVMQLILKKYHHVLSWMCMCGYFALSNCPNREVSWIIPIFGVIFGQNMSIWPSCGVHIYKVTSRCFDIYFEEIVSHFMLNVTFLIFRIFERPEMAKIRLWPPGVTIRRVTRWGVYIFYVSRHTLRKNLDLVDFSCLNWPKWPKNAKIWQKC